MGFFGWLIIGTIITLILVFIYTVIEKVLNRIHREKEVTLATPTEVFLESAGIDAVASKKSIKLTKSVSAMFEEMCLLNPLKYQNDPRIPQIIRDYKGYITGALVDLEGNHIPSEYLNGDPNPDYKKYLHNQRKAMRLQGEKSSWADKLYKELDTLDKYREAKETFKADLVKSEIPFTTAMALITDERMAQTTEEEWKLIKQQVKRYINDFSIAYVNDYINRALKVEELCDYDRMEAFAAWVEHEVPPELAYLNVSGAVPEKAMHEILRMVDTGLDINEAIRRVLNNVVTEYSAEQLREKYREELLG